MLKERITLRSTSSVHIYRGVTLIDIVFYNSPKTGKSLFHFFIAIRDNIIITSYRRWEIKSCPAHECCRRVVYIVGWSACRYIVLQDNQ